MRHRVAGYKLNRSVGHRTMLRRTLMCQFLTNERIQTTRAKAMAIRGDVERLITLARNSNNSEDEAVKFNARRLAAARLGDPDVVRKLFDNIGPRFVRRNGGYTRIFRLGPRLGDSAELVLMELVEE